MLIYHNALTEFWIVENSIFQLEVMKVNIFYRTQVF